MDDIELINDPAKIEIRRSRNVNEFLGNPPGAILSFGPALILVLVLILFFLAWLIPYPEIISAKVTIVRAAPTIGVTSKSRGAIKLVGRAVLSIHNSGKVKPGQTVTIILNGFPYQDFGVIKSTVGNIAFYVNNESYIVELPLCDSLITTYKKTILFRRGMSGTANIVVEERRILDRILDKF